MNSILDGEFDVAGKLGQGAFGEVYRAHDVALGVDRAIKILRRDAPGTGSIQFDLARQRFELEAQLGAQLEQRRATRCVRVYGFRKDADSLYLIMEYMPGGSLADRLKRGTLNAEETIRLARDAAMCQGRNQMSDKRRNEMSAFRRLRCPLFTG